MNLRPRQQEKEIGPPSFRYKPKNYIEKLTDSQLNRNPAQSFQFNETFGKNIMHKATGTVNFKNL